MKKNTIPHIPKNKNKKEINKIKYKKQMEQKNSSHNQPNRLIYELKIK
jgi:hypothetical protein